MAILTSWSLQSPDLTHWVPSISAHGVVTFIPGSLITAVPPVYADDTTPSTVHTPSISNAGVLTLTGVADTGQPRAALIDPNGAQYLAVVRNGIAFFRAPQVRVGDLVTFGLFDEESVPLLVKSIAPGPDLTARITCVDAAPGVHLAAAGVIPPFDSHITLPRLGQEPMPRPRIDRVASDETVMLRSTDGALVPRIVVTLQLVSGSGVPVVTVEVQHRLTGNEGPWERQLLAADSTMEIAITSVSEGLTYDLRCRTIGPFGEASEWVTIEAHAVAGKTSAPPDVTNLTLNETQLIWTYPNAPPDWAGFLVRVHVGDRKSWGDAKPLHDGMVTQTSLTIFRASGEQTYLVKAIDSSKPPNESLNAATLLVDYGALATRNIAESIDYKALGFPGLISLGSVIGGDLVAASDSLFWNSDMLPFWAADATLFWGGTYTQLEYQFTVVPPALWLGGLMFVEAQVQANGWRLEYFPDSTKPFWGDPSALFWDANAFALFWGELPTFEFLSWPGQLSSYTRQTYTFNLTMYAGAIQGVLSQLQIIFDMPDVEELLVNVAIASGGTRLPVTKPFRVIHVVTPILVEDGGEAVRLRVLDKDPAGPLIDAVNAAQVLVDAHGDFTVIGY